MSGNWKIVLAMTLTAMLVLPGLVEPVEQALGAQDASQYLLYTNANYGFSMEYPSDWYHQDLSATSGSLSPVAYFAPDSQTTNTWLSINYQQNSKALAGLGDQQIVNLLEATMQHNCQQYSTAKNGFTCSNPQFKSNVDAYRGIPSYEVMNTWTKSMPDGSSLSMISMWILIPVQNNLYAIVIRIPSDTANLYQSEISHMLSTFDITSVPQQQVQPTDYSNYGLYVGESISYNYSMTVQASDAVTQQSVTNIMLQSLANQIGNVTVNSIDDIKWLNYTVTSVSTNDITFNEETKVRDMEPIVQSRDIKDLQGMVIPITASIGDSYDIFSSGTSGTFQGTIKDVTTINIAGSSIPVFELVGSTRNVSQDGSTVSTMNVTSYYDKKTGLMLDTIIDVNQIGTKFLKMHIGINEISWSGVAAVAQTTPTPIPTWIKNNAKWWAEGQLNDTEFIQGIQYLIQQGVIAIPTTQISSQQFPAIPAWVKNTAKWWAEGQVTDSDFIKSVQYLVQTGIISAQSTEGAQGAVTDRNGMATFQIAGQSVQFSFVDDTNGKPLVGANVVFALDPDTQSVGTILVIDPTRHYPLQIVVLTPAQRSSTTPTSYQDYLIPKVSAQEAQVVKIAVSTVAGKAGSLLPTSIIHGVGKIAEKANFYYDSLALAAKYADKHGWLPVSQYLQNHGFETGTISSEEAMDKIKEENNQGKVIDGLFLLGSGGTTLPAFMLGRVVGETTANMDMNTVAGCPSQEVQYVQIGSTLLYTCNSNTESGLLRYNPPAETTDHISLDLLSQANQGFGERIQTDQGQPVPVPTGSYTVQVSAPGKTPQTENITVQPSKTTDVTVTPQQVQTNLPSPGVITPARDLSGNWGGSFSMTDTTSDGCSFSGTWSATVTQTGNDISGVFTLVSASSPQYPSNDFCTLVPNDSFDFQGTVSSSSFEISGSDFGVKGSFTTDLIRGTFNECSDQSCATGTFTGTRTG